MDLVLLKIEKHVIGDHKGNRGKILQHCDQLQTTLHLSRGCFSLCWFYALYLLDFPSSFLFFLSMFIEYLENLQYNTEKKWAGKVFVHLGKSNWNTFSWM